MEQSPILSDARLFTIGHGQRPFDEFIRLLEEYEIGAVADVRSTPFSRRNPEFSRHYLKIALREAGMKYAFMGLELGGRPPGDFYVDGRVDYARCRERAEYKIGISQLLAAPNKPRRLALMCSESRPEDCHRVKLIGATLAEMGVPVEHIDQDGSIVSQAQAYSRAIGGQPSLFGAGFLRSNRRYAT